MKWFVFTSEDMRKLVEADDEAGAIKAYEDRRSGSLYGSLLGIAEWAEPYSPELERATARRVQVAARREARGRDIRNINLPVVSAPIGPRKPKPQLTVEVHNTAEIDAERAIQAVRDMCKGNG